ncbi:hypothetical protein [Bacillus sp. B1-b2]|uniref:hypothetical protein n=1 Tax=Bacillus sp. B1-b2 TaxID=2653201 RepID=UPI0012622F1A|nr:hypothetical protein [Bacillus sp. B1-b2]KAB7673202.1 hypothetical protein F9279_01965 [Bacillus sp. B1-b2]
MLDFGLLNIGSLLLGLIAWFIPIVYLLRLQKYSSHSLLVSSLLSLSACGISLCFQIFYTYHLVVIEDWSALMDTMYAVSLASVVLLMVTISLNFVSFYTYSKKLKYNKKQ